MSFELIIYFLNMFSSCTTQVVVHHDEVDRLHQLVILLICLCKLNLSKKTRSKLYKWNVGMLVVVLEYCYYRNVATGAWLILENTKIWDISNSPYSKVNLAYLYAYNMWVTTMPNIFKADLEWKLIRSHMAKWWCNGLKSSWSKS